MQSEQKQLIKDAEEDLSRIPEWIELTPQEKNNLLADIEKLTLTVDEDLDGLCNLVNQEYSFNKQLQDIKLRIKQIGKQHLQDKLRDEQESTVKEGASKIIRTLKPKAYITTMTDLNMLITQLEQLRSELQYAHEFELSISLDNSNNEQE
jgi:hypothetical protein